MAKSDDVAEAGKPNFGERMRSCADGTPMQLTKRELHAQVSDARFWIGMAAVVVILVVTAPFGTSGDLGTLALLGYWSVIALATYVPCMAASVYVATALRRGGLPPFPARTTGAFAGGLIVFPIVSVVNALVGFTHPPAPLVLAGQCILVAGAINVIALLFDAGEAREGAVDATGSERSPAVERFVERLAPEKRGPIVRIATQDHYLEVTTTRGRDLVLMRMADATAMLAGHGHQAHRSDWVATDQIEVAERAGGRWILRTSDGGRVPVSRSYVGPLRKAGVLPNTT